MADSADGQLDPVARFEYFVLRLSRSPGGPGRLSGVVERLGSGEKRWFETGEQLVRLVSAWHAQVDGPEVP